MVQGKIQNDSFIRQQEKKSQEKPYCFPARRAERRKNKLGSVDELMMAASARKQVGAPSGHEDAPGIRKHPPIPPPTPATHTHGLLLPVFTSECVRSGCRTRSKKESAEYDADLDVSVRHCPC